MINNQSALFNQFTSSLNQAISQSGMTFNPSIDCRNDLVNFYGYTREQVNVMSDDELFSIMDDIDAARKGYVEYDDSALPVHVEDTTCSCGGRLKVVHVDCETRGDCEIYHCECVKCGEETSFNYAEEWYVYDEEEAFCDILIDMDNACYNCRDGKFNKAKELIEVANKFIETAEQRDTFVEMLNGKISKLSKRYQGFSTIEEKVDTRTLCEVSELSVRSYNCLVRAGYKTVQQVKSASLVDMQKVRNLGTRSIEEIQDVFSVKFI